MTHDPCDPSDFRDPFDPSTHSLLCLAGISSSSSGGASLAGHSRLHELTPLGTVLRALPRRVEAEVVPLEVELNRSIVLFFSRPKTEGWSHHGRTFSIYLCPLSF